MTASDQPVAVLVSGGLDSAVLLGTAARCQPAVTPLYVRTGLAWEDAERGTVEGGGDPPRPRPAAAAHAVLPAAGRRPALRAVQQVCGAAGGVYRGRRAGPDRV